MKRNLLIPRITLTEAKLDSTLTRLAKNPLWGEGEIDIKSNYIPDEVAKFLLNTYPI